MGKPEPGFGALIRGAMVLGAGIGGFFDGIVFHQILQWHHMISGARPPTTLSELELNTLFDGLFHGLTWLLTLLGVWLVLRADRAADFGTTTRVVAGGVLAGWGAFNVVDGILNHYLMGIHHIRPGPDEALYDLVFLGWGVAFAGLGWLLVRSAGDGGARIEPTGAATTSPSEQR